MAYRNNNDIDLGKTVRLFMKEIPRTMIYAAAFRLCLGIAEGKVIESHEIEQLLPVPCHFDNNEEAIQRVIDCWNSYVRSA
jgi:hypothetical protein